jgi:hypothetical protein
MSRTVPKILAVACVGLLVPVTLAAPPAGLKLGEEFKGRCAGDKPEVITLVLPGKKGVPIANPTQAEINYGGRKLVGFTGEVPVTLKEGQGLDVTVTVTGDNRRVFMKLLDASGLQVAESKGVEYKTVRLMIEEANASGKYTIVVVSDQIGGFTLQSKGGADDDADADKLREKIKQREKELADLKAKLRALEDKRSKDPD